MSVYHAEFRRRALRLSHIVAISLVLGSLLVLAGGCTPRVYQIGVIAPLSGTLTDRGVAYYRGAELAAGQHSERLLHIDLTIRDSRNSHLVTRRFAEELINEVGVDALLAPPAPALSEAVLSLQTELPIVTTEPLPLSPCQFSLAVSNKVLEHARILFDTKQNTPSADTSQSAAGSNAVGTVTVGSVADVSDYQARLYHADDPRKVVQRFVETYRARYGVPPDINAALGYDAVSFLVSHIKQSIRQTRSNSNICAALSASTGSFIGVTGEIRWDPTDSATRYTRTIGIVDTSQNPDRYLGFVEVGFESVVRK